VRLVGSAHLQLLRPFDLDALKFVVNRATVLHGTERMPPCDTCSPASARSRRSRRSI